MCPISLFLIFFFSEVDERTVVIGDKIVNSTPDLAYSTLARKLKTGIDTQNRNVMLFVVEVFISELTVVNIYIVSFSLLFLLRSFIKTLLLFFGFFSFIKVFRLNGIPYWYPTVSFSLLFLFIINK